MCEGEATINVEVQYDGRTPIEGYDMRSLMATIYLNLLSHCFMCETSMISIANIFNAEKLPSI